MTVFSWAGIVAICVMTPESAVNIWYARLLGFIEFVLGIRVFGYRAGNPVTI